MPVWKITASSTYADNLAEWADAAWVGSVGPFWPESVTWKWKVPDGVSVADLRDSERDLLEENRVNFMTAEYKHEYMVKLRQRVKNSVQFPMLCKKCYRKTCKDHVAVK